MTSWLGRAAEMAMVARASVRTGAPGRAWANGRQPRTKQFLPTKRSQTIVRRRRSRSGVWRRGRRRELGTASHARTGRGRDNNFRDTGSGSSPQLPYLISRSEGGWWADRMRLWEGKLSKVYSPSTPTRHMLSLLLGRAPRR